MIVSVIREHHWAPDTIGALYIDEQDYNGLIYWYEDCKKIDQAVKSTSAKKQ